MYIETLLTDLAWDKPFFKKLANNDTGFAPGHQAGIVVPIELRDFFPGLSPDLTRAKPTSDSHIRADLIVDGTMVGQVVTRYQFQTWGGTRKPESRLTDNLGAIRKHAVGGDYLVLQRSLHDLLYYRLILVRRDTTDHQWIAEEVGTRRWGTLLKESPLKQSDVDESLNEQRERESEPFDPFDTDAARITKRTTQLARSIAFRQSLLDLYECVCVACGNGLQWGNLFEVEGAHIVPRYKRGSDDSRNGLVFCRTHHWAFDKGLFYIDSRRHIVVPEATLQVERNRPLAELDEVSIRKPSRDDLAPAEEALEWHRENIVAVKQ